jgi:hypothetical protein
MWPGRGMSASPRAFRIDPVELSRSVSGGGTGGGRTRPSERDDGYRLLGGGTAPEARSGSRRSMEIQSGPLVCPHAVPRRGLGTVGTEPAVPFDSPRDYGRKHG